MLLAFSGSMIFMVHFKILFSAPKCVIPRSDVQKEPIYSMYLCTETPGLLAWYSVSVPTLFWFRKFTYISAISKVLY